MNFKVAPNKDKKYSVLEDISFACFALVFFLYLMGIEESLKNILNLTLVIRETFFEGQGQYREVHALEWGPIPGLKECLSIFGQVFEHAKSVKYLDEVYRWVAVPILGYYPRPRPLTLVLVFCFLVGCSFYSLFWNVRKSDFPISSFTILYFICYSYAVIVGFKVACVGIIVGFFFATLLWSFAWRWEYDFWKAFRKYFRL